MTLREWIAQTNTLQEWVAGHDASAFERRCTDSTEDVLAGIFFFLLKHAAAHNIDVARGLIRLMGFIGYDKPGDR